ncbi:MAG: hypothetical protein V1721_02250 [Pseudomonadota bacterium]
MGSFRNLIVKLLAGLALLCFSHTSHANDVVGKLENAKIISGVVTGSGVDSYTFEISRGSSFVVSVSEKGAHAANFVPGLTLKGPDNNLADAGAQEFFYRSVGLSPAEGKWTVEVGRGDGGNNGGAYELRMLQAPAREGTPLQFGQSYAGSIMRGAVDVYKLGAAPGDMGQLALASKEGAGFSPEVMVFGPRGEMVGAGGCTDSCNIDLQLMAPGTYTIMVWRRDKNDTKGSYTLSVNMPDGTPGSPGFSNKIVGTIKNAKVVTGAVKGAATDSYTFKVARGSSFIVTLSEKGDHTAGFIPDLKIFGPDHNIADGGAQEFYIRFLKLEPQEGDWRAEVSRIDGGETGGNYELRLLQAPGAKGTPMKFGQTYTGTITRGEIGVYTISGTPDVLGRIILIPKEGAGFTPEVTVFAPNGEIATAAGCTERCYSDLNMTELGDYTVMVGRSDNNDVKGVYSISVARSDGWIEEPVVDAGRILQNISMPIMPHALLAMNRRADIYVRGMFLTFSPHAPFVESMEKLNGNPLTLLALGDRTSDTKSAISYWKRASDLGNADARNRLGMAYAKFYKDKKYESAAWYRLVVDQGKEDPEVARANMFLTGVGAGQDFAQAKKLYRQAAEKGGAVAQFNLGALYTLALDTPPDFAAAATWYGKAAEQGLVVAQNNLAELYEHGQGVKQDDANAVTWYLKAAESGYPQTLYSLAKLAVAGRGMPKDAAKAAAWLKLAADGGHADAQVELDVLEGRTTQAAQSLKKTAASGDMTALRKLAELYRKDGVPTQDYDDVLEIYRNASREINPQAFAGLADLFAKQDPPDYFEAYFWYILVPDAAKAAQMPPDEKDALVKYASAEAGKIAKKLSPEQVAVAKWRIDDRHPRPLDKAREAAAAVYMRAATAYKAGKYADVILFNLQAAHQGVPRSQLSLGHIFEAGTGGVSRDIDKAIGYYKQSVRGGLAGGAKRIGDLYRYGIGVPRNLDIAAQWYEMDASRGYKPAVDILGLIYLSGLQGKKAIALYEKAAARDVGEANAALGMIYLYGVGGVPSDIGKALKWYLKSADKGYPAGAIQAASILKDYEPRDYGRALKLVSSFGTPVALNNKAFMYEHGLGVKEQEQIQGYVNPTAMELYKKAADMCYGRAMYNIGRLYETGADAPHISAKPLKKSPAVARKWMERAAQYGSGAATVWLDMRDPASGKRVEKIPQSEATFPPEPCPKEEEKK